MKQKNGRVFLIVLDSVGIGEMPDAAAYGDEGSNTLAAASAAEGFAMPNMANLGLFHIDGVTVGQRVQHPMGSFARLAEASKGKDTTTGHWEIGGIVSHQPMPTYPNGFPPEVIDEFSRRTGYAVLCNKPYSGTQLLTDYGQEHVKGGNLLVYTSADSVFQIAAHEDVVPVEELYRCCEVAREMLTGKHGVGRVIARPFVGEYPNYTRTANRRDFSLLPPRDTMLDLLLQAGYDSIGVGKIYDIFAGKGVTRKIKTKNNADGMAATTALAKEDFSGLCFVNLVDFDMTYGHRNDVQGYGQALTAFDRDLGGLLPLLKEDDILLITADHGCDPATPSTDHSREYVPLVVYGAKVRQGVNLGTRSTFADIAATILEYFGLENQTDGESFLQNVLR